MKEQYIINGFETEPLLAVLSTDYTIGIVLVRLGHYSIGVCQGEKLILHDSGTGLVHGRQRQGGSSAARFQRRRQDQTHHFLERVGEHLRERLEPYAKTMDYFVYGGARVTILKLQKQVPFLKQFNKRLLPPLLEIQDPRFSVLEKVVTDIWSSKITELQEELILDLDFHYQSIFLVSLNPLIGMETGNSALFYMDYMAGKEVLLLLCIQPHFIPAPHHLILL